MNSEISKTLAWVSAPDGGGGDMIGIKGEGVRKGGVGGGGLIGVIVRTGHSQVSKNSGYNSYYNINSDISKTLCGG